MNQQFWKEVEREFDDEFGSIHKDQPMPSGLLTANKIKSFYRQKFEEYQKETQQDIQSVLSQLGGIKDEKARKIENYIKKYLLTPKQ